MKERTVHTPALDHLVGAYFHEDWTLDGTEQQVIARFIKDEPDLGAALPLEIHGLLATVEDETEIERLLEHRGCYYWPEPTRGYRGWLTDLASLARRLGQADNRGRSTSAGGT